MADFFTATMGLKALVSLRVAGFGRAGLSRHRRRGRPAAGPRVRKVLVHGGRSLPFPVTARSACRSNNLPWEVPVGMQRGLARAVGAGIFSGCAAPG
jgi:hypothetical protein